ncbi:sulfotransferase [Salinibacter ruber]|uniref:sulfotransferase n=1 Tax=Salinibacter ruber TaxID=146919 RepID=UPI003C6E7B34
MTNHSRPTYIIGRQHCGNTMLATMLWHHPDLYAFTNEGNFFEHVESIRSRGRQSQIQNIAHEILRSDGSGIELSEIISCLREQEGLNAFDRYIAGKDIVAAKQGASRWVQKATSYVFQVESILQAFPDAKLLFLVRNPLDLAASVKRRGYYQHHIGRNDMGVEYGRSEGPDMDGKIAGVHPGVSVRGPRGRDGLRDSRHLRLLRDRFRSPVYKGAARQSVGRPLFSGRRRRTSR